MLLPGVSIYIIYKYIPIITGILVSLKEYKVKRGVLASPWAKPLMKYFNFFFNSPFCSQLIGNTLIISLAKMLIGLPMAVILALLLNECKSSKLKRSVQTLTYMPHFLSWVIVGNVAYSMFREYSGLVNMALMNAGIISKGIPFLTEKNHWAFTYLLMGVWQGMGWGTIIYLAAITGISGELYEAAGLDGANNWQKFLYVTWPQLRSTTFFVVVMLTINCFKVYDIAIMLAGGGDGRLGSSSTVLVYYIYQKAFVEWDLGYSSAIAMVLFVLVLIVTLIQFRGEAKLDQ